MLRIGINELSLFMEPTSFGTRCKDRYIDILIISFVLAVFTRPWYTVISITCASFAVSVLVPCYILLSFDFVSYSRPGFVIIVLVFLVPLMKLVCLALFIL